MHFQSNAAVLAIALSIASALPTNTDFTSSAPTNELITRADATCTPRSPPPAGSVCGKTGSISNVRQYGATGNLASIDQCLTLCSRYAACLSWSWDPNGPNMCRLYAYNTADSQFTPSSSSSVSFYDMTCYNCVNDGDCNQNTFSNGKFESGFAGWSSSSLPQSSAPAKFGVKAAGKGSTGKAAFATIAKATPQDDFFHPTVPSDGQIIQLFQACPGKTYDLAFDVKFAGTGKQIYGAGFEASLDGHLVFDDTYFTAKEAGKWKHFAGSAQINSSSTGFNIQFFNFDASGPKTFMLDNVSVTLQA